MTNVDSATSTAEIEMAARPVNRPATLAMIAGLLSFLPGVGLVAIGFGLAGGNRARVDGVGRGKAFAGVVLGIASLFMYAVLAGAYFQGRALMRAKPAIDATRQFIISVGDGNVDAARRLCVDNFDRDRLTELAEQLAAVGVMQQPNPYYGGAVHSTRDIEVQAELKFDRGVRVLVTHWDTADGPPRLTDFTLTDGPTTQPASPK